MATIYRDKIVSFGGSWGSGMATLTFESGRAVHGDNGPLARGLIAAFDAHGEDHSIDNSKLQGQDIVWAYDDIGLCIAGFTPYQAYLDLGNPEIELGGSVEVE